MNRSVYCLGWLLVVGIAGCNDDMLTGETAKPPLAPEVLVKTSPASAADCPYGGTVVSSGLDSDGNGTLDAGEVRTRTAVCNDAPVQPAPPPSPIVVRLVAEPVGDNCREGGTAVQSGPDKNGNGKLDDDEVSHIDYVCGEQLLKRMVIEPPGTNCPAGGLRFVVGRDRDHDGTLDDGEIENTEYECSDVLSRNVTIASTDDAFALAGIAVINGSLTVRGLADVVSLPRLQHLGGSLSIDGTDHVTRFAAPELRHVGGDVSLTRNRRLTALELPKLQTIVGGFFLEDNAALADLTGLHLLTRIDGDVEISRNAALTALPTAIRHIGGRLFVVTNPSLSMIDLTIADRLALVAVIDNGTTSIRVAVTSQSTPPTLGTVDISGDQLTSISLEADTIEEIFYGGSTDVLTDFTVHASQIQGDMDIRSASLRNLTFTTPLPFQQFELQGSLRLVAPLETLGSEWHMRVHGICSLSGTRLTSLSALSSVNSLDLGQNVGLTKLSGFEALSIRVINNQTLESIKMQQSAILGFSEISSNPMLRDISFGDVKHTSQASLEIDSNPKLTSITAPSLVGIDGQLAIQGNSALTDVSFDQLGEITDTLLLLNNPALTSFSLPSLVTSGTMFINTNATLQHLAFDALTQPTPMNVVHNHKLPACELEALFARIPGDQFQEDNDDEASCTSP